MRVEYHPAIEGELREIIQFYNQSVDGLGAEFLNEFEGQILAITANPELWVEVEEGVHRALMRKFPFVIYYRLVNSDLLRVTVVKHQRRHPKFGMQRE